MATTEEQQTPEREQRSDSVKCDNHPDRDGVHYTQGGAVSLNLCEECTPPWFQRDE